MTVVKTFKGGSLSSTCLIKEKNKMFVRKSVLLNKHREYGFNRWYSQLKKTQRMHTLFPMLFPKVLRYGKDNEYAFFDIPYYKDMVDGYHFISNTTDYEDVKCFFNILMFNMQSLYQKNIMVNNTDPELLLYEIIAKKIDDSLHNKRFLRYLTYDELFFNDSCIPSFINQLENYKKFLIKYYSVYYETFTHGNLTLENILYNPATQQMVFIDLYDEIIIDHPLMEYSQLLQSCNSKYELYNQSETNIKGNHVYVDIINNQGLDLFNNLLNKYLDRYHTDKERKCIALFEISQFIHMLPFKAKFDTSKTIFFYTLASKMLDEFIKKEGAV